MDADEVIIEEINTNEIPAAELSQFHETQPLKVVGIIDCHAEEQQYGTPNANTNIDDAMEEGVLISRYMNGEGEFPELYTTLKPGEEDDEEEIEFNSDNEDEMSENSNRPQTNETQQAQLQQLVGRNVSLGCRSTLNTNLKCLMGEANIAMARDDLEKAERICLEIIRQNPLASDPFYTLADIYDNRNNREKLLHTLTIAAHLNSNDRDNWTRIAEMHIADGSFQLARVTYTKAIKALFKDYDLRLSKGQLLERMGDTNAAMFTYLGMLPFVPESEANLCIYFAKKVVKYFHGLQKYHLALQAMKSAYKVCGKYFTIEDLNLYMELLILNKQYVKVISYLREHTSLQVETESENDSDIKYFCSIPDDYGAEMRTKLCVCLIHLHAHHLLGYLIQNVHEHIAVTSASIEQYMDITEALMQEHKYAEAIALMRPITDGDVITCPAFVWLRHAECLRQLNRTNEAIEIYAKVVSLAPYCYEAKFTLSALLKQQGRHAEAVKALEQSGECEGQPLHARLLYERCIMLQELGRVDEFLEVGYVLLSRHSVKLKTRQEMIAASNGGRVFNADNIRAILEMRNITDGDSEEAIQELQKSQLESSDLDVQDEYTLFLELMRVAFEHKKYSVMERICFSMVTTRRFVRFHIDLERIIILACYFNNDCSIGFSYLREIITKNSQQICLWNLLSLLIQKGEDLRFFRYIKRLIERGDALRPVRLFLGHYHINCSSYKYALNFYVPLLRVQPQAITALCIGVVFNQVALQKKVLRRSAAVGQALTFIQKYAELRSADDTGQSPAQQEIYYNIGRLYHQAGILHLAVEYYERALAVQCALIDQHANYLSLQHEIAFNLHLIYLASGNKCKARQYLYRYCVV